MKLIRISSKKMKKEKLLMSKTVREIAELMGVSSDNLVKEKQRIRDEIKRQNIETKKSGNKFVIVDSDVEKIVNVLKKKVIKEDSKKKEENEDLLRQIEALKAENSRLKVDNKKKNEDLIRRLRSMLMTLKSLTINSCN